MLNVSPGAHALSATTVQTPTIAVKNDRVLLIVSFPMVEIVVYFLRFVTNLFQIYSVDVGK